MPGPNKNNTNRQHQCWQIATREYLIYSAYVSRNMYMGENRISYKPSKQFAQNVNRRKLFTILIEMAWRNLALQKWWRSGTVVESYDEGWKVEFTLRTTFPMNLNYFSNSFLPPIKHHKPFSFILVVFIRERKLKYIIF